MVLGFKVLEEFRYWGFCAFSVSVRNPNWEYWAGSKSQRGIWIRGIILLCVRNLGQLSVCLASSCLTCSEMGKAMGK